MTFSLMKAEIQFTHTERGSEREKKKVRWVVLSTTPSYMSGLKLKRDEALARTCYSNNNNSVSHILALVARRWENSLEAHRNSYLICPYPSPYYTLLHSLVGTARTWWRQFAKAETRIDESFDRSWSRGPRRSSWGPSSSQHRGRPSLRPAHTASCARTRRQSPSSVWWPSWKWRIRNVNWERLTTAPLWTTRQRRQHHATEARLPPVGRWP